MSVPDIRYWFVGWFAPIVWLAISVLFPRWVFVVGLIPIAFFMFWCFGQRSWSPSAYRWAGVEPGPEVRRIQEEMERANAEAKNDRRLTR